jgi:hypothetical protein
MPIPRMRPSFITVASCPPEGALTILRERLDDNSQNVEGSFSRKHGTLRVGGDKQHFWSPCLDITIIEADDSYLRAEGSLPRAEGSLPRAEGSLPRAEGSSPRAEGSLPTAEGSSPESEGKGGPVTKVWGTFSPRPEIWVGFVFAIGVCAVVAFLALLFAIAQMMLGLPPWALLVPVVAILVAIGIYTSAIVGQGLSIGEMYRIRSYLDECLKEAERRARFDPPTRTDSSSQL